MTRRVRTAASLDPRSQSILRAVIEEYVDTATPVGSAALVERYRLGVSSATVRNIFSDLESAGSDDDEDGHNAARAWAEARIAAAEAS